MICQLLFSSGGVQRELTGSGAFARDSDVLSVASKITNISLNPLQCTSLISQGVVAGISSFTELPGGQIAENSEAIAKPCQLPYQYPVSSLSLDVHTNDGHATFGRHLDKPSHIILRPMV